MKLIEAIQNIETLNDEAFLYVKRVNGKFTIHSKVVLLELNEEELEWKTHEVTKNKCPGFNYFLEVFLAKEFIYDLKHIEFTTVEQKCARLISYVENDA